MDHQQLFHVQASFALVQPQTALAAQLFYQRLFYLNPALRPLFQGNNQEQETQLVRMLTVVVNGISQPERTIAGLQQLGARHSHYGVKDEDYDTVGAALLWTLRQGLGDAFTEEVEDAWVTAYSLFADQMLTAA